MQHRYAWLNLYVLIFAAIEGCEVAPTCEDLLTCKPLSEPQVFEPGVLENCLNGIDDDADGAPDCEDTDCDGHGFRCIPKAPPSWQPIWTRVVPIDSAPWKCPNAVDGQMLYLDPLSDPIAYPWCEPCACDDSNVHCLPGDIFCSGIGCFWPDAPLPAQGTACYQSSFNATPPSYCWFEGNPTPSSQAFAYGGAPIPVPKFAQRLDICQPVERVAEQADDSPQWIPQREGICQSTEEACMQLPSPGSAQRLCVLQQGIHSCPDGFPLVTLAATKAVDTRHCNSCSCTSTCDGGLLAFYNSPACNSAAYAIITSNDCADIHLISQDKIYSFRWFESAAFTQAQGGMAGGIEVLPSDLVTVCCL